MLARGKKEKKKGKKREKKRKKLAPKPPGRVKTEALTSPPRTTYSRATGSAYFRAD